jgi:hypothetical protein
VDKGGRGLREMTEGRIVKTQQNPLFFRLYLLGSGGCQPLLAVSLNQRVQGSSPCAPTIEIKDLAGVSPSPVTPKPVLVTRLVTFRQA